MSALGLIRRAIELEVPVVQIADNLPLHVLDAPALDQIATTANAAGVDLEVGMCGFTPSLLRAYLAIAVRLGSPHLRVVVDSPGTEPSLTEIQQTLETLFPEFERERVDLLIENHDRFTARELRGIMEAGASDRLGVVLDTVNSLGALESCEQVLDELRCYIRNVHIKDVHVRRTANRMGFEVSGAPAGQGDLRLHQILTQLFTLESEPTLILEQWPPFASSLKETIAREDEWARAGVRYLSSTLEAVRAYNTEKLGVPAPG